ncbi:MAG: N-formylglutamate amidohydrolase [Sphingomonas sp.]|nr:N-formylglutamate amidohydrolase [Sphingomonas sp.]
MTVAADPPFLRIGPERPASPVVISVPHAGRAYRADLLLAARVERSALELLEDRYADRLVWQATEIGATAFIARAPRAEIDLNREEREIDAALVTPPLASASVIPSQRARGGIGLIPSRIAGHGPIWRGRIPRDELTRRIVEIHRPYHAALDAALRAARDRFGGAILLDCHSMPPGAGGGAAIVFGDCHGITIAPDLLDAALATTRARGFAAAVNAPYAGGYIVTHHGRPERAIHALQIEIDRAAYLDAAAREPGPGFADICTLVAAVAEALGTRLLGAAEPLAAE